MRHACSSPTQNRTIILIKALLKTLDLSLVYRAEVQPGLLHRLERLTLRYKQSVQIGSSFIDHFLLTRTVILQLSLCSIDLLLDILKVNLLLLDRLIHLDEVQQGQVIRLILVQEIREAHQRSARVEHCLQLC